MIIRTVSYTHLLEVRDLCRKLLSGIRVRHHHTLFHFLYDRNLRCILMVPIKWFMFRQRQMVGIEDQCIARDPRLRLVGLGKTAIDHEELSVALDRTLACLLYTSRCL